MKALQSLTYSKDKFKTVSDAWSHTIHLLSYSCYNPSDYKPRSFYEEMNELFEDYVKYGFLCLNEKGSWIFNPISIEDGLDIINA